MKKNAICVLVGFAIVGGFFAVVAFCVKSVALKWIFGIISILVCLFLIIMVIDHFVKIKRKSKTLSGVESQDVNREDIIRSLDEANTRSDMLYDGQRRDDADFGYSDDNPIMSNIFGEERYIKNLRTMDDKPFTFERLGAIRKNKLHGVRNVMVDQYQLYLDNKEYKIIYICPYGHYTFHAPQGMKLLK